MSKPVYYEYFPRFFSDKYPEVFREIKDKCRRYEWSRDDKVYLSRRASCIYSYSGDSQDTGYGSIDTYSWDGSVINELRLALEDRLDCCFDYVLAHIYETGEDYISPHFDNEALNSTIASVSFGAARKFRMRKITETKGWEKEFRLVSGDMIVMWGPGKCGDNLGCQRVYKHYVPKETRVKLPRINLTFRQWEED